MQASPQSDDATWGYGVRRVVSGCSTVLLVAVKTAVTRWQPGAVGKDQGASPVDDRSDAEVLVWSASAVNCGVRGLLGQPSVDSRRAGRSWPCEGVSGVVMLFR